MRYRFLETVREYGLKQLAAAGGIDEVRGRLRAWAVGLARELLAGFFAPDQVAAMDAVPGGGRQPDRCHARRDRGS